MSLPYYFPPYFTCPKQTLFSSPFGGCLGNIWLYLLFYFESWLLLKDYNVTKYSWKFRFKAPMTLLEFPGLIPNVDRKEKYLK